MALYVPAAAAERMERERQAHHAELVRHLDVAEKIEYWNRLLKDIDPALQLVKAMESTTFPGLRAGYYHVLRDVPGAPPSIFIHEGPNGEFREPDAGMLDKLRRGDMWSDRVQADARRRDLKLQKAAERQREREREERIDETFDRYKSRYAPGTLIKGVPWKKD